MHRYLNDMILDSLDPALFAGLTSLQTLYVPTVGLDDRRADNVCVCRTLSGNPVQALPAGLFDSLTSLTTL